MEATPRERPRDAAPADEPDELARAAAGLERLRAEMLAREAALAGRLRDVPAPNRPSARNLLHYVTLRSHDLRRLQPVLARHGLSSLGRAEPHVLASVEAVLRLLERVLGRPCLPAPSRPRAVTAAEGTARLELRTAALLGPAPGGRAVRIMVTAPTEAADDYPLVRELLARGMDCMRINCAHDDPAAWERMIGNLRRAEREAGRSCRVLMDLTGPRVRTGALEPGPQVVKVRPRRDALGWVVRPARVWLTPAGAPEPPPGEADATFPVNGPFLDTLATGDRVRFTDAREAGRSWTVTGAAGSGRWARCAKTAYVVSGTPLRREPRRGDPDDAASLGAVGELPGIRQTLRLAPGDELVLTAGPAPGRPARTGEDGAILEPARIPLVPAEVLGALRAGERIWFDEGRIGGVVEAVLGDRATVRVDHAHPAGDTLGADKGINLPETELPLPPLTPRDLQDLEFVVRHADLVGYSFVRTPADVHALQARLAELGATKLGVVLKVETRRAFDHLPGILLASLRTPVAGVMIARGDLAVECGFERMAEVQEEILWLCEAAHTPVVWATQVLERLSRDGLPSRAEVTDAAMAERAECVMLNKGPYVLEAVRTLDDILRRMQAHQEKKRPMLRRLSLADGFFADGGGG